MEGAISRRAETAETEIATEITAFQEEPKLPRKLKQKFQQKLPQMWPHNLQMLDGKYEVAQFVTGIIS